MGMPGKSFQSKLEPHFDLILEARRNHQTWEAIAHQLADRGITTTRQAVHAFLKRRLKRRYPLGAAPAEPTPIAVSRRPVERPPSELPELTENLPIASEFGPDPLTRSVRRKWGIVPPT
jgi:hypothetical protein